MTRHRSTTAIILIFSVGFGAVMWTTAHARQAASLPAERVTGIGGVFFKARDPKSLAAWYQKALGVDLMAGAPFAKFPWRERDDSSRVGSTAWSLFSSETKYFAPSTAPFMINYRVNNLEGLLSRLRAAGVTIEGKVVEDFNGKFGWVMDPEGNKVELWEPKPGF